jgi:Helix-turn-helix domain
VSTSLIDLPVLLTPQETAEKLRVKTGSLAVWRCTKRYDLPYLRIGRAIRYRASDVAAFIERQPVPR